MTSITVWSIHGGSMVSARALLRYGPTLSVGNVAGWDANPSVRHFPLLDAAINPGIDNPTGSTLAGDRLHPHPGATAYRSIESGSGPRALIRKTLARLGVDRMRPFSVRRRPFPFGDATTARTEAAPPKDKQKNLAITRRFKLRTLKEIPHAKDHFVA